MDVESLSLFTLCKGRNPCIEAKSAFSTVHTVTVNVMASKCSVSGSNNISI